MATKIGLTKDQVSARAALVASLTTARESLDEAIAEYNQARLAAHEAVSEKITEYNEALEAAREFASEFASAMSDAVSERSDKWQEGEKGEAAQSFVSEWEGVDFENFEIDEFEEVEAPDDDAAETLGSLPESPEE